MTTAKRQNKIKSVDQKIVDLTTHNTDGCLLWTGKSRGMTPYITHRREMINVRKHLYEETHGEVGTKQLIPSCGNAACVHPHHTVLKTQSLDHYKSLCAVNRVTGCWHQTSGGSNLRRKIYELAHGEPEVKVSATCGHKDCVNPDHNVGDYAERFWNKVKKESNGCWTWTASRLPNGYGKVHWITDDGLSKNEYAHRVAYMLKTNTESIPEGSCVTHTCDHGHLGCVNPKHLSLSNQANNIKERQDRNRHQVKVLSDEQVRAIRRLEGRMETWEVGEIFNVGPATIYKIWKGKQHKKVA